MTTKQIGLIGSFLIGFLMTAFSQNPKPHEINYYYFVNNQIKDIRDHSVVLDRVSYGIVKPMPEDGFILHSASKRGFSLKRYDKNKELIYTLEGQGKLSPNWDYVLRIVNSEIHFQSVDLEKGELGTTKQLTQTGLFQPPFDYVLWYGDFVTFAIKNQMLHLDVRNGALQEVPLRYGSGYKSVYRSKVSSNGRYSVMTDVGIYDIVKNQILYRGEYVQQEPSFDGKMREDFLCWVDSTTYLSLPNITDRNNIPHLRFTSIHDPFNSPLVEMELEGTNFLEKHFMKKYCNSNVQGMRFGDYVNYSEIEKRPHREVFIQDHLIFHNKHAWLLNLQTGNMHQFEEDISQMDINGNTNQGIRRIWVSPSSFIYSKEGDVLHQGTYLYDTKTHSKTKLSPYVAEGFWVFEQTDYVLIKMNNGLYRCQKDGSKLTLIEENLRRNTTISLLVGNSYFDKRR